MKCPGCGNETASTVLSCLKCDWEAPELPKALEPPPPPTGLPRKVKAGLLLIALAILATVVSLAMAIVHGGGEYGLFVGGLGGGLILILRGIEDRRLGRG